jgi:hypothetical protein
MYNTDSKGRRMKIISLSNDKMDGWWNARLFGGSLMPSDHLQVLFCPAGASLCSVLHGTGAG